MKASSVTLQLNLSAGDIAYCEQTVPALARAHRAQVGEVLVVADCCRPQATPFVDADLRFPREEFERRIASLRDICARLQAAGSVDRVVFLEPDPHEIARLNGKYTGLAHTRTHDHLGHAFSAYFCGWDAARTRYVIHSDADILLYQAPGFEWVPQALAAIARDEALICASPRICPPDGSEGMVRIDAPGSGWLRSWPLERSADGWRSDWVSTRLHLMDRERLARLLPLRGGRSGVAQRLAHWMNGALAPLFGTASWHVPPARNRWGHWPGRLSHRVIPAHPLPPEVLLNEALRASGARSLYLSDARCWYIHPDTKPREFLTLLPQLLRDVAQGEVPPAQRGVSGLDYAAWRVAAGARALP